MKTNQLCCSPESPLRRNIMLPLVFAAIAAAVAAPLITAGHDFDSAEYVEALISGDSGDSQQAVTMAPIRPLIVQSAETLQASNRDDKPCEDVMWTSLKGKCLSFTKRKNHHHSVGRGPVYFVGR